MGSSYKLVLTYKILARLIPPSDFPSLCIQKFNLDHPRKLWVEEKENRKNSSPRVDKFFQIKKYISWEYCDDVISKNKICYHSSNILGHAFFKRVSHFVS